MRRKTLTLSLAAILALVLLAGIDARRAFTS